MQQGSLGYLADRCAALGLPPLLPRLSRLLRPDSEAQQQEDWAARHATHEGTPVTADRPQWVPGRLPGPGPGAPVQPLGGARRAVNPAERFEWNTGSGLDVGGRIVLNVWRLMRHGEQGPAGSAGRGAAAGWGDPT